MADADDLIVDEPIEEPAEPIVEEPVEEIEEPAGEAVEAPVEEPAPSPREQRRIRQLLEKYGPPPDKTPDVPSQRKDRLDYNQALEAEPEVIQQLEQDRQREGQSQYIAGLEQAKSMQFHTRLEIDAPKIETKYPQLNPESEEFDAETADDINALYLYLTGYDANTGRVQNPNIRYSDFVEAQMGLAGRISSKQTVNSAKNIAKQAANTGLRPGGNAVTGLDLSKHPKDMSDEELKEAAKQEAKALRK